MFNFQDNKPQKRYGRITRGLHTASIHQASRQNSKSGHQYIRVDFEIINERECKDILVPGFFYYDENGKADPRFLALGKAAGLTRDYGKDLKSVLRDLIGRELCIFVNHRYKNGRRRERAEDFKPVARDSDREKLPNEAGDLPF